jgi:hemerythrin-like domain-containing protein
LLEEDVAHALLRAVSTLLSTLFIGICSLLSSHIRREENQLFQHIQVALTREALEQAGAEIERRAVQICL